MPKARLDYIDNLRVTAIVLVILVHQAVTYSGLGNWYVNEVRPLGFWGRIFFEVFQTNTQGFFMGLLFLLAGYFTPGALRRKGLKRFLTDRFWRLGAPSLFYMLFVTPFVVWFMAPKPHWIKDAASFGDFMSRYLLSAGFGMSGFGPMWFAVALFFFSCIYAALQPILPRTKEAPRPGPVSSAQLFGLTLVIALGAFLLRLRWSPGEVVLGMQLAYFSQYVALFAVGIWAYNADRFEGVPSAEARKWLLAGFVVGIGGFVAINLATGRYDFATLTVHPLRKSDLGGSLNWVRVVFDLWESFVSVALSVGLLGLFRDKLNIRNKLTEKLSASAFAVYMFHPPILILVTQAMAPLLWPPVAKWAVSSLVCVPLCFAVGYYVLLRIPLLKRLL